MIASQVKSLIKDIAKTTQDDIVGNGAMNEKDVWSAEHIGGLGRKQVVHHYDLRRIMLQKFDDQIGADEARPPQQEFWSSKKYFCL